MREINPGFIPIFSGITPTANMVLPTYHRQLQYIERVLNQLVKDVENNFIKFDEYTIEQFKDITAIVRQITADTIEADVEAEVIVQIEAIIGSFDDLLLEIQGVKDDLVITDNKIAPIQLLVNGLQTQINDLDTLVNNTLVLSKDYSDLKLVEAKLYTDQSIEPINDSIDLIDNQILQVPTKINDKVDPVITRVETLEADKLIKDSQIADLDSRIDASSTTILGLRVSDVENKTNILRDEVDVLNSASNPDVSGLTTRVNEAELAISTNTNGLALTDGKVANLEIQVGDVELNLLNVDERLDILEAPTGTELGDRVDNLESTSNLLDNRVTAIEVLSVEDSLGSLDTRVNTLEELSGSVNPDYPTFIEFPDSGNGSKNRIYLEINPWDDFVSYKGKIIYNMITDASFIGQQGSQVFSTTLTLEPLNLADESSFHTIGVMYVTSETEIDGKGMHTAKIYQEEYTFYNSSEGEYGSVGFRVNNAYADYNNYIHNGVTVYEYTIIMDVDLKFPKTVI